MNAQITDIPIRLLQSVRHIPTLSFTAMIEYVLHPIVVKYCQDGINEYCRDSTHYLLKLDQWKSSNLDIQNKINEDFLIVVADVVALYPNINRNMLRNALTTALDSQSKFCSLGQRYFVELPYFPVNKPNCRISRGQFLALKMMVLFLLFIIILLIGQ